MKRYLTLAVASLLAMALAAEAHAVLFTFDDPVEVDEWWVLTDEGRPTWTVEDGVLRIQTMTGFLNAVRVVRGLQVTAGTISMRFRVARWDPNGPDTNNAEVGVAFRVKPDPNPPSPDPPGYPGQYVLLHASQDQGGGPELVLDSANRAYWANEPPNIKHICCGGSRAPLDNWHPDEWSRLVVTFNVQGWHEVYLDTGAGLRRVISADVVLGAFVASTPGPDWVPFRDGIETGDAVTGTGSVGIFALVSGRDVLGGDPDMWIEVDEFGFDEWLEVTPRDRVATTWGQLKAAK